MIHPFVIAGVFALGFASSKVPVGNVIKSIAKKAFKAGEKAGENLKSAVSGVNEDLEDAKAEAEAEIADEDQMLDNNSNKV